MAVPKVSIGMPVYNGEQFLSRSIESLLEQTFADFELVISDNGSTDQSPELIRKYAAMDSRIRYELNDVNRGAAWNYNHVRELAHPHARYVKWAAADDEHLPDYLSRTVAILEQDPTVVLAHTKTADIDESGSRLRTYDQPVAQLMSDFPAVRIRDLVTMRHECFQAFGLVRAWAARMTRGHGAYPDADNVYLVELALLGRFVEDPHVAFLRRQHASRSMVAFVNQRERMKWFDPNRAGSRALPYWRTGGELVRAIARTPLTAKQRRDCYRSLSVFIDNNWQGLAKNLLRAASVGWVRDAR
ncbi:MAG TPA: glycosyltransferase family 2 protein [Mycobacteriales bacterium]|nr:glycosyltransferase family 2 protein [Mycobacteriales bacterium]